MWNDDFRTCAKLDTRIRAGQLNQRLRNMEKGGEMRHFGVLCRLAVSLFLVAGCGSDKDEGKMERLLFKAGYLEDNSDSLSQAITTYRLVAKQFPSVLEAERAAERAEKLSAVEEIYRAAGETVQGDSAVIKLCRQVLLVTPDYRPAIRRLGIVYHKQIDFIGQLAASPIWHQESTMHQAYSIWKEQDELWSDYEFLPRPKDREWGDRLCRASLIVANMLGRYDRYAEAVETVERGLYYAETDETKAEATVWASYYNFWLRRFDDTIRLAQEALDSNLLTKKDKGRAYHALGMGYAYLFQDSKDELHLERSIKNLNESVVIDPYNNEARKLLKAMREAKGKLSHLPAG